MSNQVWHHTRQPPMRNPPGSINANVMPAENKTSKNCRQCAAGRVNTDQKWTGRKRCLHGDQCCFAEWRHPLRMPRQDDCADKLSTRYRTTVL